MLIFVKNLRFCESECHGAICCALSGIKPYKSNDWSQDTIVLFTNWMHSKMINHPLTALLKSLNFIFPFSLLDINDKNENFIAKIIDYDFDAENNKICLIQLLLNNENESIVDYLLTKKFAEVIFCLY